MNRIGSVVTAGFLAVTALAVGHPASAAAASGSTAYDVSYPQCGVTLPADGSLGIVGVNNGRPWDANPCLASEYAWAAKKPSAPQFYLNTANPAPRSSFFWPATGARTPALCRDSTSTVDPGCAYDYGWHAAQRALSLATSASTAAVAKGAVWWLDVEIGNTWNGDGSSNAADIQGGIDFLRAQGVPTIGIYSTDYQWTSVTGGYTVSTAPSYTNAWAGYFSSPNGIKASPNWIAGAGSASQAASYCNTSFTGVPAQLAQYPSGGFDANLVCGGSPPPRPGTADYAVTPSPSTVNAAPGAAATSTITLSTVNAWSGSVNLSAGASSGATARLSSATLRPGQSSTLTVSGASPGRSYSITVTATPAGGSSTTTQHQAVVTLTTSSPAPPPPPSPGPPPGGGDCNNC